MKVEQPQLSIAGFWQPIDDSYLVNSPLNTLVAKYGVFAANGARGESVVLVGWSFAGDFGGAATMSKPAPVHIAYLSQAADGRLFSNSSILGSDLINGAGSVIIEDFNRDGRNDIFLAAHNESPFAGLPSTAYLSNAAGTFNRVVLSDAVAAHDAQLVTLNGQPAVVTKTFPPGEKDPTYVYTPNGFQKRLDLKLSTEIKTGASVTVSPPDANGRQFAVIGDVSDPPGNPFKIHVYEVANGDITGSPVSITPYLSTLPQYRNFESFWGPGVTHTFRVWTDDFNNDGRFDIVAGTSLWTTANMTYPGSLDLIQNDGNRQFRDVTAKLNPDYALNSEEADYSMRMVDLDDSGIKSYLMAGATYPGQTERQGNYLLVNDGTGRLRSVLHGEFVDLSEQVRSYLANSDEVRAKGLPVPPEMKFFSVPQFIGYSTDNGHLNYVADVTLMSWLNGDPKTNISVPVHVLVNVPLDIDLKTAIRDPFDVSDRNGSQLIRTFAGDDTITDVGAGPSARIDGGLGADVVRYSGPRSAYAITAAADGWQVTSQAGAPIKVKDTLVNIEVVAFSDGTTLELGAVPLPPLVTSYPAVALTQFITGSNPSPAEMSVRVKAATDAYNYYANVLKVANPNLGPYESLGVSFSYLPAFQAKYGAGTIATNAAFVDSAYQDVFLRGPTVAQEDAFLAQINYFTRIYQSVGMDAAIALQQARGAVVGQMVGYVMTDPSEYSRAAQTLDDKVISFVGTQASTTGDLFGV